MSEASNCKFWNLPEGENENERESQILWASVNNADVLVVLESIIFLEIQDHIKEKLYLLLE